MIEYLQAERLTLRGSSKVGLKPICVYHRNQSFDRI
jgi:hypothetical protein